MFVGSSDKCFVCLCCGLFDWVDCFVSFNLGCVVFFVFLEFVMCGKVNGLDECILFIWILWFGGIGFL